MSFLRRSSALLAAVSLGFAALSAPAHADEGVDSTPQADRNCRFIEKSAKAVKPGEVIQFQFGPGEGCPSHPSAEWDAYVSLVDWQNPRDYDYLHPDYKFPFTARLVDSKHTSDDDFTVDYLVPKDAQNGIYAVYFDTPTFSFTDFYVRDYDGAPPATCASVRSVPQSDDVDITVAVRGHRPGDTVEFSSEKSKVTEGGTLLRESVLLPDAVVGQNGIAVSTVRTSKFDHGFSVSSFGKNSRIPIHYWISAQELADSDCSEFLASGGTPDNGAGNTESPSTPSETVTPSHTTMERGAEQVFTASGFTPGEDVTFTVHSDPIVVGSVKADSQGGASIRWNVPRSLPVGKHTVVAQGATSGKTASSTFSVIDTQQTDKGATTGPQTTGKNAKKAIVPLANTGASSALALTSVIAGAGVLALGARRRFA